MHHLMKPVKPTHFRRLLLNAAQGGLVDKAEEVIAQMYESGLEPGPRAFHCLAFAHVRAKAPEEALATARRASDAGVRVVIFDERQWGWKQTRAGGALPLDAGEHLNHLECVAAWCVCVRACLTPLPRLHRLRRQAAS
jgi:pentatricopeptide repeat protein